MSTKDAAHQATREQIHLARNLVDRFKLEMWSGWDLDDDLVLQIIDFLAFDKNDRGTGQRRFDSIREGAQVEAPVDHLAQKNGMSKRDVLRMIRLLQEGGRLPKDLPAYTKSII